MVVTTVDREYHKAICVDAKFFTRIEKLVSDSAGRLRVDIWLSDSSRIEGLSISDLISFPNLSLRKIVRVNLNTPYDATTRLSLTIRNEDYAAPVSYEIVGNDRDATYLSAELDKLLRDTFVWYSRFSVLSMGQFIVCPLVIGLGFMAILIEIFGLGTNTGAVIIQSNLYIATIAAIITAIAILYLFMRKRWFPVSTFMIGDGVIRANKSASIRRAIASILFGGIGLGLLVHIFGSRIYDSFFRH